MDAARIGIIGAAVCAMVCASPLQGETGGVTEAARSIPVACDVDVVVVGGSTGAVTAAVEAAKAGAKVFLAAPKTYLGEDVCATYRLWLEPGEEPRSELAKKAFAEPVPCVPLGKSLRFRYSADKPSSSPHGDTSGSPKLSDGRWTNASTESVQYNDDVTLTLDLGAAADIGGVHVASFVRGNDFQTDMITVWISDDQQTWREVATIRNEQANLAPSDSTTVLRAPMKARTRYLRVKAVKSSKCKRQLLAEIVVTPAEASAAVDSRSSDGVRIPPTPMQVKRTLEEALVKAGVQFLYSCCITDVLKDASGELAGIVMANRSGRQAVRARVIIDATWRASVARIGGANFSPYPSGTATFQRVVIGGEPHPGDGAAVRRLPAPIQADRGNGFSGAYPAYEYTLSIAMPDAGVASFARAEQVARDRTWDPGQLLTSDELFQVPQDSMKGRAFVEAEGESAERLDLNALCPEGLARMYVLGGSAGVSRPLAARLVRPLYLMDLGVRVGRAAAEEAKRVADVTAVGVAAGKGTADVSGEIREGLRPLRPSVRSTVVTSSVRSLPIVGTFDVVVIGGGTGGAPAGISAARQGARTLVVEYLDGLGGVGTLGLIGSYYYGHLKGFTAEIDEGVAAMGPDNQMRKHTWNVEWKMEWYRRALRKAGAEIWFGVMGCGALVEDDRVKGVVVATPQGRAVVLGKVVIDATGNADIAAAAGAECMAADGSDIAVQGTGMPPRKPGAYYTNTDYTITDDSDVLDVWRTLVSGRAKYQASYDLATVVDSRERRRIIGDFVISPLDIWNQRTYPDTIGKSYSNFDTHGYTIHPFFTLKFPNKQGVSAFTPYRSLLPRGLDGILVIGLAISAHRDAMPILRMQGDIQNQGYAAGVAAAMIARSGSGTRQVDIKALQRHLVEKGNVPDSVLTDKDSYPLSEEKVTAAVSMLPNDYEGIEYILTQPEKAVPLLRSAYQSASDGPAKIAYAHVLAMLGDPLGVQTIAAAIESMAWDSGWSYTGGGQFGASLSRLDSMIIALGVAGDPKAVAPVLRKAAELDASREFSHHRAVALALERLRTKEAAPILASVLKKPEMSGWVCPDIQKATDAALLANPNLDRDRSIRELVLARALYRCGDHEGLGRRILDGYAQDLRGHLAAHAQAVLGLQSKGK